MRVKGGKGVGGGGGGGREGGRGHAARNPPKERVIFSVCVCVCVAGGL